MKHSKMGPRSSGNSWNLQKKFAPCQLSQHGLADQAGTFDENLTQVYL
jgi:hypothetical protein